MRSPLIPASVSQSFPADLLLRAQGIKLAFFDVDGVLTDGGLYMSSRDEPVKRFHVLDGHGLRLLQQAWVLSLPVAWAP